NSIISDQEVLSNDDIAGAQSIYGVAPVATPPPTPGPEVPSHLVNISTRMRVGLGEDVSIAGVIVRGSETKRILFRGIGPSLADTVPNPLGDPVLELHDSTSIIASNDDWQSSSQINEIAATGLAPANPYESV